MDDCFVLVRCVLAILSNEHQASIDVMSIYVWVASHKVPVSIRVKVRGCVKLFEVWGIPQSCL